MFIIMVMFMVMVKFMFMVFILIKQILTFSLSLYDLKLVLSDFIYCINIMFNYYGTEFSHEELFGVACLGLVILLISIT